MVTKNAENNQGDGSASNAPPVAMEQQSSRAGNPVFKSGPLFISSKGIGWTSWKKRWFILTQTSLVFFRSDPSVIQKGGEANLTLGGIDLNNSGSVVVKEDKKLLTVLFPNGRDGRAFTLKAETLEDLYEWKSALEAALAQAPSAALVMGQNGIFRNDQADTVEGDLEQCERDKQQVKSSVVGRPILLALEDVDGTPSFLEKALKFIEQYGVRVEGILRQAADVDDVEHRVKEYEHGKTEFSPEEDAHVIADCIKLVLRELPSPPVPASCCNALLEACRASRGGVVNAMRTAISESFPEPNRLLLQRILKMMQVVASHKSENRMSSSAVAACMAPLLLRPLLAGDCELGGDFTLGGDGSAQLMKAAAAANHAQAIVITLLEEYEDIFGEDSPNGSLCSEEYSETDESGIEDDENSDDEILEDGSYTDSQDDLDAGTEEDADEALSGTFSESSGTEEDVYDNKISEGSYADTGSPEASLKSRDNKNSQKTPSETQGSLSQKADIQTNGSSKDQKNTSLAVNARESPLLVAVPPASRSQSPLPSPSVNSANESTPVARRPTVLGRTPAKRNLPMESIEYQIDNEIEIQRLQDTKTELQNRIAEEAKENSILHESLGKRKAELLEVRLNLEQDVARLREQLQKERELRAAMEAGLKSPSGHLPVSTNIDKKTKAELEEIAQAEADVMNLKQKVTDLSELLNRQHEASFCESCGQKKILPNHHAGQKDHKEDVEATGAPPLREALKQSMDVPPTEDNERKTRKDTAPIPKKAAAQKQQIGSAIPDNKKSIEVTSSIVEPRTEAATSSKTSGGKLEDALFREENEEVRTQEIQSCLMKPQTLKQEKDSTSLDSKKTEGVTSSPSEEPQTGASNSKKAGVKLEAAVTTSSALSKITTRLNFLKERRTQIANELHNIDNSRGSDNQSVAAPPRTNPS